MQTLITMIHSFIDIWAENMVKKRWVVILVTIAVLIGLIFPMQNLYFDNSSEMWFLENDPSLKDVEKMRALFGNDQYLVIGVQARKGEKTVLTKENLITIHKITEFLEDHELVEKVASVSKYQYIHSKDEVLTTEDLIEDIEEFEGTPEELQRIETIMRGETMAHDFLITKDLRHTVISARNIFRENTNEHFVKLSSDIRKFLKDQNFAEQGYQFHITGDPWINDVMQSNSERDTSLLFPLVFALVILFLIFSFRRISGVFMPLIVIIGSVIVVVGMLGVFGWPLTMVNVSLPAILIAVGVGDSVHIIVEYYHSIGEGKTPSEASVASTRKLFIPCFNTSLTTLIGFLALSATQLVPLRQYGIIAGIGVVVAFLISVTTLPALLSFYKTTPKNTKNRIQDGFISRFSEKIVPFTFKYRKIIFLFGLLLTAVSVWYSLKIEVDANYVNYFKVGTAPRVAAEYFDEMYNGIFTLELILDSKEKDGIREPSFLKQALKLEEYLESLEETGKANSMLNYLRKMHQTMNNDDPEFYQIPETRGLVAQYLLLYSNSGPDEDLSDMKSFDERYIRISLRIRNMPTSQTQRLVDKIQAKLKSDFKDLNAVITGNTILFTKMDTYINEGLARSFSIAFLSILVCFFVLFKSFRYGLLAMIPCVVPILAAGGILGGFGIYLDFSTMMVAAITFGIAVDDTIHIMNRYLLGRRNGKTRKESMHLAVTESGRAIIFTSLILYFSFSVMILSVFVPNIYFGFLAGTIIMMAMFADLILLPSVVFLTGDKAAYPIAPKKFS